MAKGITRANRAAQDDKEKAEKAAATAEQEQQLATQRQQLKVLQDQTTQTATNQKRPKGNRPKLTN